MVCVPHRPAVKLVCAPAGPGTTAYFNTQARCASGPRRTAPGPRGQAGSCRFDLSHHGRRRRAGCRATQRRPDRRRQAHPTVPDCPIAQSCRPPSRRRVVSGAPGLGGQRAVSRGPPGDRTIGAERPPVECCSQIALYWPCKMTKVKRLGFPGWVLEHCLTRELLCSPACKSLDAQSSQPLRVRRAATCHRTERGGSVVDWGSVTQPGSPLRFHCIFRTMPAACRVRVSGVDAAGLLCKNNGSATVDLDSPPSGPLGITTDDVHESPLCKVGGTGSGTLEAKPGNDGASAGLSYRVGLAADELLWD